MGILYQQFERFLMRWSSPERFYQIATRWQPRLFFLAICLGLYGLLAGLYLSPADYQQGDAFRIIYVHVPSAFLSMFIYMLMASQAAVALIWRVKLGFFVMRAAIVPGIAFTFLALITGSIWAKPMWGTWWVWDARLTSELILLFLYIGLLGLHQSIRHVERADKATAVMAIIGALNVPVIHYSVYWWFTLHQGATLSRFAEPAIDVSMRYPLYAMLCASFCFVLAIIALRTREIILHRLYQTRWVKQLLQEAADV